MNLESFGTPRSRQIKSKRPEPAAKFTTKPETREELQEDKLNRCGKGACEVAWKPVPLKAAPQNSGTT